MDFDSAPKDASVENLLELCEVLREGELPREELNDAVDQGKTLVRDNIRYGIGMRFLEEAEDGVSATSRGIEASYNQDNSEDLAEQFQAGLREYQLYNVVLKELVEEVGESREITKSDVLQVFRTAVGLEGSEKTLGDAATTFIKTLGAAGLGEYIVGRGGKETRLEIDEEFEVLVDSIIEEQEPNQPDQQPNQEKIEPQNQLGVNETLSAGTKTSSPFQISLELSGDEDPTEVEELIVAVRRGLTCDITESDPNTSEKSIDKEELPEVDQTDSAEEMEFSDQKKSTGSETDSSDSSLNTFMGSASESGEE